MRYFIILFLASCFLLKLSAQDTLRLHEAVGRAVTHKPSLQVLRLQTRQQQLSVKEAQARWWPDISLAYDYRYNPVVATTVIPIGQFDINNPTNTVRGIKMGTKWQQNAGLTLSQPLINWAIGRNVKRARLATQQALAEQKVGRDELIYETARSYLLICRYEKQVATALNDTLRTYTTWLQQEVLYRNERLLRSDLNRARINHNNALNQWQNILTELIAEKLYLAFLTGIPTDSMLSTVRFDSNALIAVGKMMQHSQQPDSLHTLAKLRMQQLVARQDVRLARAKSLPTLAFEAFVGGNQYNDCLSPFEKHTWYGSSYLGISLRLPILYQENFSARNKRLRLETAKLNLQLQEQEKQYQTDALIALQQTEGLQQQIDRLENNKELEQEVLNVLGKRFHEQRATPFELNLEELEYLKIQNELQEKYSEQILQRLEYLKNTGLLYLLQAPVPKSE